MSTPCPRHGLRRDHGMMLMPCPRHGLIRDLSLRYPSHVPDMDLQGIYVLSRCRRHVLDMVLHETSYGCQCHVPDTVLYRIYAQCRCHALDMVLHETHNAHDMITVSFISLILA
ncbi:hypothetical protein J1N35_011652 [Gossypium stocksii]|uniref:Uncharacterized protein n=1 Tax=Gossypium stocksii TaxID=47602 RepID=A0A9D3W2U2_9ROSI|nr:hypothetical protein J1N35_011652 [Gossypium stocksii]